jgi:TonB-linked SusC/RagA family outer membrane protein
MKKVLIALSFMVAFGLQVIAQTTNVTGTVTDAGDGFPIPGVSVFVKGTTIGTVTMPDGKFSLAVPSDATTIVFSFVGMTTQEVAYNGQTTIDISLQSEAVDVDEVVVTALGIKREKKALGYAVQEVNSEEIGKTGNANLASAMQGKVAGVDIKPSSGMPGASSQIVIRGARSFTGNNTPLYVVDGQPISSTADFSTGNSVTGSDVSNRAVDINPADIESINILKGQAAAALYGIRASNGVVIITTKSGKGNKLGKVVVNVSHNSSFDQVSRTPDYQKTYSQGNNGLYVPNTSMSWGPKIVDLPNDPNYGAGSGKPGAKAGHYYVPQLVQAGYSPEEAWVMPKVYDNFGDYFRTGYTGTNSISVSQAQEKGNFAISLANTDQEGIALNTGMQRWNAKGTAARELNDNFKVGFTANYVKLEIDKLSGANDAALAGVLAAPLSYDLKGIPSHKPGDPYSQIYYRGLTFNNPYWVPDNLVFNEQTERFFGNSYVEYNANLASSLKMNVRYQLGMDTYTTHFQDIFGYGHKGGSGLMDNYGVTSTTYNSLLTANFDWSIDDDFRITAILGNEINHNDRKTYSQHGEKFNFGGWNHIDNTNTQTMSESQWSDRTVGVFGSLALSYKSLLFLNATGRNDIVSTMPRGNRSFFYPSVSLGFVASELEGLKDITWLSFAKIRGSYAEVGQAGRYRQNYYDTPSYGGGFYTGAPINYPLGSGINSYIPNSTQYDPNLKPQNTQSYEVGIDLKFFNNRFGVDYTYSRQNVKDQIFAVPLAGSTGASSLMMNGGKIHTDAHEVMLYITPVQTANFTYDMSFNYSKVVNIVDELAEGVESIFMGGFVTPQVRASIGDPFPVIYGDRFLRDDNGNVVVVDNPGAPDHGMPQIGTPGVIGNVAPDFILGHTSTFTYRSVSLSAVFEWKQGGEMYSGTNGLMDLYGVSKRTEDRESTFIYPGVKPDGTPNDIVRGGENDKGAYQELWSNVLGNIDEHYIHENSFVKLREVSLRYNLPRKLTKNFDIGVNVFTRNILLWSALENLDPESSQGNNNMGGSFERFSMPQTTSYGFGVDVKF